jgi:hypothetical protein
MKAAQHLKGILAGTLLSGSIAVGGFGLAAGTAHADTRGPYHWCPGQHLPDTDVVWDMNVCHIWCASRPPSSQL